RTAMQVTERLASLFIDESLRDREVLAEGTNQFLDAQLEDARRQLVEHEKKVEEYRKKYDGQLPDQEQSNLQQIQSAEMQLQNATEALSRDRDQAVILDRQITDLTADGAISAASAPAPLPVESTGTAPAGATAAQQLALARAQLQQLETRLKPEHPDVVHMKRVVADLEKSVAAEAHDQPAAAAPPMSAADRTRVQRLSELRLERERVTLSMSNRDGEIKRLQSLIADYQARVAAAPTREADLVGLTRDYDTLQKSYSTLLAKSQDSQIAANLERRQIGEQFKVLDAARLPEKPVSPNRPLLDGAGAFAALLIGVGLVALLEYRDTSLKTEGDVGMTLRLPVLGTVPTFVTAAERTRHRRRTILASAATVLVVLATTAAVVWKLRA
ncbi:MAG TPA: GNVR domain-containing protein, partial [Vicinamibacterales bacterium]